MSVEHENPMSLEATLAAVDQGAAAIERHGPVPQPQFETPCSEWRAHDLIRHLEIIAGAYLLWAGSSVGGRVGELRVLGQLNAYNARMLQRLPDRPTADHLARWRDLAADYRRLIVPAFDRPMLQGRNGTLLTVGEFAAIAAIEWHIHGWDLAQSGGSTHRPAAETVATLAEAWRRYIQPQLPTTLPDEPTWDDILRASGRTP